MQENLIKLFNCIDVLATISLTSDPKRRSINFAVLTTSH